MSDRRGLYKNADRDFGASRRNRQDHSIEIRKVKKEDNLQKRRNIQIDDVSDSSPVKEINNNSNISNRQINILSVKDICKMMKSRLLEEKIEAVTNCRKQLSKIRNPPIEQFYKNGAIPILVEIMKSVDNDTLLFEAAWALTNIASGESRHTEAVVTAGSVPIFIDLMRHREERIAEQSVWALANIAGDNADYRDFIIKQGIIPIVVESVRRFSSNNSITQHLAWFISNLCRHKSDTYPVQPVISLLPVISEIMSRNKESQIQSDLTWALSYATDNNEDIINAVIAQNILPLIKLNLSRTNDIVAPSIRLMGNIIAGTDEQANAAISVGIIDAMVPLLVGNTPRIVKECCWLLSNISAGTEEQVMTLVDSGCVLHVLQVLQSGDYKSQKEAVWVVSNMISCVRDEPKLYLLNNGIFTCLIPLLSCDDNEVIKLILDSVRALLTVADKYNELEQCISVFEAAGGIDVIEQLQNHSSDEVYKKSYELVKEFFGEEEDEEDGGEGGEENMEKFAF